MEVGVFEKLIKLYWSIRYTEVSQLLARLKYIPKRWWHCQFTDGKRVLEQLSARSLPGRAMQLQPIFPNRGDLAIEKNGRIIACFLGREEMVEPPVDWDRHDLDYGTRLELLNLHYMEYLESVDHEAFIRIAEDWIAANHPYKRNYWLSAWNSYALSVRVVIWMQQLALRSEFIESTARTHIEKSICAQVRFLLANLEMDVGGNHLLKNIKALIWAGVYFAGSEADGWLACGKRLLSRELRRQFCDDGMHFELSPSYHAQVTADLIECAWALGHIESTAWLADQLARMVSALGMLTHPDGLISLFSDGGLHMSRSTGDIKRALNQIFPNLTCSDSNDNLIYLNHAGYYGLRLGTDYLLFDAGRIGADNLPAHGHGDILSFEWDIDGRRVFVDPGVFEYHPGWFRDYSRATTSHNTVSVGNMDQGEFHGSFRLARRANVGVISVESSAAAIYIKACHDGFSRQVKGCVHQRQIRGSTREFEVIDDVTGESEVSAVASFLLSPECRITGQGKHNISLELGHLGIHVETTGEIRYETALWFPDLGISINTNRLCIAMGRVPTRVVTRIKANLI